MEKTLTQYDKQFKKCRELFENKTIDYGTAWRILRPSSLTDQIFIKANRIRTIQETGEAMIDEGIEPEFIGIVNYCIMALIQLEIDKDAPMELPAEDTILLYNQYLENVRDLMQAKNHDYGEAWRDMRISSLTDLILMKVLRTKQIEDNKGETLVSEGIDANYYDMINYALFSLILMEEEK